MYLRYIFSIKINFEGGASEHATSFSKAITNSAISCSHPKIKHLYLCLNKRFEIASSMKFFRSLGAYYDTSEFDSQIRHHPVI